MTRLLIVGQAPSRRSDPKRPLSGEPLRGRLIELLGVASEVYDGDAIQKVNLINYWPGRDGRGDLFHREEAATAARRISVELALLRDPVSLLMLGNGVARAFRFDGPPLVWSWTRTTPYRAAVLPHPSGVNRWWNDASNRRRATRFMRKLGRSLR